MTSRCRRVAGIDLGQCDRRRRRRPPVAEHARRHVCRALDRHIADDDRRELARGEPLGVQRSEPLPRQAASTTSTVPFVRRPYGCRRIQQRHQRLDGPHRRIVVVLPDRGDDLGLPDRELGLREATAT